MSGSTGIKAKQAVVNSYSQQWSQQKKSKDKFKSSHQKQNQLSDKKDTNMTTLMSSPKSTTHWTTPSLAAIQRSNHWKHREASIGRLQLIAHTAQGFGLILVYSTGINSTARGECDKINIL